MRGSWRETRIREDGRLYRRSIISCMVFADIDDLRVDEGVVDEQLDMLSSFTVLKPVYADPFVL